MKNEKARVFGETTGLHKNLSKSDSSQKKIQGQSSCTFCWRALGNNSMRFDGIRACRKCFQLIIIFVNALHENRLEYVSRFNGKSEN